MDTFWIKTKIQFGEHALEALQEWKQKKVWIVTDPFLVKSNLITMVTKQLQEGRYEVFSEVVPDPPLTLIVTGLERIKQFRPEVILAFGGGSALDTAKGILQCYRKIENVSDITLVAIPTTSGTGSEVTSFAVLTDQEKGKKFPLVSEELLPDVAILETELVKSVPPAIVADTGMDVLTHAIEAYVSTKANVFSDALAEKAVRLVFLYLQRSFQKVEDKEAKEQMHLASCLAGIAFNEASLGLNHAVAHNIGGKWHLPHGRTNAILLPYVIEYNANLGDYTVQCHTTAAKKYAMLAKLLGFSGSNVRMLVKQLIRAIQSLQRNLKMPRSFSECKITTETMLQTREEIAAAALADACIKTNPRGATKQEIVSLLQRIG